MLFWPFSRPKRVPGTLCREKILHRGGGSDPTPELRGVGGVSTDHPLLPAHLGRRERGGENVLPVKLDYCQLAFTTVNVKHGPCNPQIRGVAWAPLANVPLGPGPFPTSWLVGLGWERSLLWLRNVSWS